MMSIKEQHHRTAQDAAVSRLNQALERLEIAWDTAHARRSANGMGQFDAADLIELDTAEEEWLAARRAAASRDHIRPAQFVASSGEVTTTCRVFCELLAISRTSNPSVLTEVSNA